MGVIITMIETWKPVPDFNDYEVSDLGRVRSFKRGSVPYILKPIHGHRTYLQVHLRNSKKSWRPTIHTLVLKVFVGPRPDGFVGSHVDSDRHNNRLSNLTWETQSKNLYRSARMGRYKK